jgi:hypothetical protein
VPQGDIIVVDTVLDALRGLIQEDLLARPFALDGLWSQVFNVQFPALWSCETVLLPGFGSCSSLSGPVTTILWTTAL